MITDFDARRACHWSLLRLAGRVPDGLLTAARRLLAQGRYAETARIVTLAAAEHGIALHRDDLRCVAALLGDRPSFDRLDTAGWADPMPRHTFSATAPSSAVAPADEAVVAALADEPSVHGVWRAWRTPAGGGDAKPVFVAEVDQGADAAGLAARLQDRLLAAGEADPCVEAYEVGAWLPAYQRTARSAGTLLWSRDPDRVIHVASLIDGFVGLGLSGQDDAERIQDAEERDRILRYLDAGSPVLITTARVYDALDRDLGRVVPMNFRTDGTWIWNDISAYHLRHHGVRPDAALVAHIAANGYEPPEVDGVAEFRAIATLYWTDRR